MNPLKPECLHPTGTVSWTQGVWVQAASRQVAKQSSVMDAQLFTIKQLLILREQIAPFEADFAVTEYDLDFSHMRDHLRRIMAGMCPYMPCLCADVCL